ncbi:MAG TPA: lysophospholipid acyltransferase family protein, partial [Candidatus Polarisedimenticolaceae bacterium]|nr:lysophospholipid acyltransferase family protein [Candidatus Polarisedimenticolaceae bacterium]
TMAAAGFVFVDRRNRTRAMQSLDDAARTIRNGRSVMLFAEGTRSRDGTVQPFKKGPFHLALKAGVPVVPVAIRGSWAILKPRSLVVTPGVVDVRILEPLEVAAWLPDDVQGLLGRVRQEIVSALGRAS